MSNHNEFLALKASVFGSIMSVYNARMRYEDGDATRGPRILVFVDAEIGAFGIVPALEPDGEILEISKGTETHDIGSGHVYQAFWWARNRHTFLEGTPTGDSTSAMEDLLAGLSREGWLKARRHP